MCGCPVCASISNRSCPSTRKIRRRAPARICARSDRRIFPPVLRVLRGGDCYSVEAATSPVLLDFLKEHLHPSSPVWVVATMGVGAIWLWRRPSSRGPRWYFTAVVLGYWFMTTPFGAGLLVNGLSR